MTDLIPRIVVVGSHAPGISVRVNHIPAAGETVIGWNLHEPQDGGKGTNQAIAATRLGAKTSFVGCIGIDRRGIVCENLLQQEGVEISHLYRSESTETGAGLIILDKNGVPAMVSTMGANDELTCSQVEKALSEIKDAGILLTQFEIKLEVALFAIEAARRRNITTILNPAPATQVNLADLKGVDLLTPNEIEAKQLLEMEVASDIGLEELAQELKLKTGSRAVVITAGEKGIVGIDGMGFWQAPPPQVQTVDTSGAGDVFCAALAVSLIQGMDHRSASVWACSAASLSVTKAGTIPSFPTRIELEEFIRNHGQS